MPNESMAELLCEGTRTRAFNTAALHVNNARAGVTPAVASALHGWRYLLTTARVHGERAGVLGGGHRKKTTPALMEEGKAMAARESAEREYLNL